MNIENIMSHLFTYVTHKITDREMYVYIGICGCESERESRTDNKSLMISIKSKRFSEK